MARSLLDLCFSVLAFALVGTAFASSSSGNAFFAFNAHELLGIGGIANGAELVALVLAGSILSGALAERCGFWASMLAAVALGAVVLPLPLYWTMFSSGLFAKWGAGGLGVVYPVAGAVFAWVGIRMIGPRANKYHRDGSTGLIPGHNLPLAVVGAMVAVVGLIALNLGALARPDQAIITIAAGGVAAAIVTQVKFGKPDIGLILTGVLGAAVASTAAGQMPSWAPTLVGAGAGLLVPHFAFELDTRFKTDDPIGGVSIFGVGGAWGLIMTGLLHSGTLADRALLTGKLLLAYTVIALWTAGIGFLVFTLIKRVARLRAKEADEFDGLDLAEHDVSAYPDFQQNTIRSFHMREA